MKRKQSGPWDHTIPTAWRYEYTVTEPTNLIPRLLRSSDILSDRSLLSTPYSCTVLPPVHPQMYSENEPDSHEISRKTFAFPMAETIFERFLTIPGSERSLSTSSSPYLAMMRGSNPSKASRNASLFFRMHSHESPAWKHSRRSISYSFPSSCTGTPHSLSWYST